MNEQKYDIDFDHCKSMIKGVCDRCGGELEPLETVNNSRAPTYWAGCKECAIFCWGVNPIVFQIASKMVEEGYVSYSFMNKDEYKTEAQKEYYIRSQNAGACQTVHSVLRIHEEITRPTEDKLLEAMENIKKHIELSVKNGYELSGIWNIANKAIKEVKQ